MERRISVQSNSCPKLDARDEGKNGSLNKDIAFLNSPLAIYSCDHSDSSIEIDIPVLKRPNLISRSSSNNSDGKRKRTSFYTKSADEEIGHRLSNARRTSTVPSWSSTGFSNSEVVMVPLLLNAGRRRYESENDDSSRHFDGRRRTESETADDSMKYKLTYLDLMSMQIYGASPSERVVSILNKAYDRDHVHNIFCELETFSTQQKWKERGRWVKYEESIEESGDRWSKPHVSMLFLQSLFELRKSFLVGEVMLDIEVESYDEIIGQMLGRLVMNNHLKEKDKDGVKTILNARHQHGIQADSCKCSLVDVCQAKCRRRKPKKDEKLNKDSSDTDSVASYHKFNSDFLRKVPEGCEAINIMVAETDFLPEQITAFVRLKHPLLLPDMPEVEIPTRFMFVLLGPCDPNDDYKEIGRCMATLMSDEVFREIAYFAHDRKDLLAGVDEFMSQTTILPPGKFDPEERIEPPYTPPCQKHRLNYGQSRFSLVEEQQDSFLRRTGKLFGGLVADVKRKFRHYKSDFTDALHMQCVASFIFMYIACLTPAVTIGGLMGDATDNNIGAIEALVSAAICGTTWHLFSGQPLTIIGATGPLLVFEKIMYPFCQTYGINYLPFRFWTGMWISLILFVVVMFDLSFLVRFITRFTEEGFAMLIALIFIVEAFKKLFHIMLEFPVDWHPDEPFYHDYTCFCSPKNGSSFTNISTDYVRNLSIDPWVLTHYERIPVHKLTGEHSHNNSAHQWDAIPVDKCQFLNGTLTGPGCNTPHYVADVFFFSCSLFLCTFAISIVLKGMKNSKYFTNRVCAFLSDFAVPIAIITMAIVDHFVGIHTPKLTVPDQLRPTRSDRGWLVNPLGNPLWSIPAAIIPALLASVLIFMDQQITAVIVNRREHKLKKGCGYHLDILIIALQITICSAIGTPWFVAATMESINHVRSLSRETETSVPGERPRFLGVREQRVTGFLAFVMIGTSAFLSMVLKYIPMPVLFGVFFFMGISALRSIQLVERILIMFMPTKYQPDYLYLRHVRLRRVHLFTLIQILCLVGLWTIKLNKKVSILFPLMVLALCFIRKGMDWIFTNQELTWLDDILPDSEKKDQIDHESVLIGDIDEDYEKGGSRKSLEMTDIMKKDSVVSELNGGVNRKPSGGEVSMNGHASSIKNIPENPESEALLIPEIKVEIESSESCDEEDKLESADENHNNKQLEN